MEIDIELDQGEYIVIPRTSGCTLRKNPFMADDPVIRLLEASGEDLNPLLDLTVREIFRRLDKIVINNSLEYAEFQDFYKRVGTKLSEEDFRKTILRNYCSSNEGG